MTLGITGVTVIGGGLAGMTAAARATELGLKVTVLEAGTEPEYMCNSRITGGIFHVAMNNVLAEPAQARAFIERATHGYSNPQLADALAHNARRAVDWLRSQGIRFIKGGPGEEMNTVLSPPKLQQFGLHWKGRGGDVLLRTLAERVTARGGTVRRGVRALSLLMENGRCVGVSVEHEGNVERHAADAVVIADGGFQANRELLREYISPAPDRIRQRNAETGRGDGLRMAAAVGAKLVGLDRFYGHVLHRDAMANERLWPYPIIDILPVSGMIVDANGSRFTDEGLGGVSIANAIAALGDPLATTVIFDDVIWRGPGREGVLPPNPNVLAGGATVTEADDLSSLAVKMSIPPNELAVTVEAYNRAIVNGRGDALMPPRTTARARAYPIVQAPFRAVPVCSGITYTMGGIAIDEYARVLKQDGAPLPGLYAAGAATGGLEGGPFSGYTGGLSKASVFGLLAAESIAQIEKIRRASAG